MEKFKYSIYYLQEINYRIAYSAFGTTLFFFTTYTYKQGLIFIFLPKGLSHFVSTGLTEIFFTYLQLCTNLTISFAITILLVQSFFFLKPGLYKNEADNFLNVIITTVSLNIILYTLVSPIIIQLFWKIFYSYTINFMPIHLTFEPRFNDYVRHFKQFNTLLTFILPSLIITNLLKKHTTTFMWVKYRGLIYVLTFTLAAFITPPDIISQILIGTPMILFYEVQILCKTFKDSYKKHLLIRKPVEPYKCTNRKNKKSKSQWQKALPT